MDALIHNLEIFLTPHTTLAYFILFFGAYFETVFPFSFLLHGEVFFLSGSILAGLGVLNIWAVTAISLSGGILGDNTSFLIGRTMGRQFFERVKHWWLIGKYMSDDNFSRAVSFFETKGFYAVFIARLAGPLSWVTPFLAGTFKMPAWAFFRYNAPGVMIGVSEFMAVGYFAGANYTAVLRIVKEYATLAFLFAAVIVAFYFYIKKSRPIRTLRGHWQYDKALALRYGMRHITLIVATGFALYILVVYLAFST
jgi:membrane-associated protein